MKKYNIIYADPPWHYGSGIRSSKKIDNQYQYYTPDTTIGTSYTTQNGNWISSLPVSQIAADASVLFLWTTDSHLPVALDVIKGWGFTYKTVGFIWNKKEKSGKQVCYYGNWTMKGSEICLLATRGTAHKLLVNHSVRQLVEAERDRTKHSQKPHEVRRRIVEMFGDLPRIELFARQQTEGWDVLGDGINGKDIYQEIMELTK
jgi:site-specific DNA-methyltransferase (adenine-specific)